MANLDRVCGRDDGVVLEEIEEVESGSSLELARYAACARPVPVAAYATTEEVDGVAMTAILRVWEPGDVRTCRRCPSCTALPAPGGRAMCLVLAPERVPDGSAALYALPGAVPGRAAGDRDGVRRDTRAG